MKSNYEYIKGNKFRLIWKLLHPHLQQRKTDAEPKKVLKTEIAKMRFYKCQVCRDIVDRNQNYCGGCGKRLEWSEEDANV